MDFKEVVINEIARQEQKIGRLRQELNTALIYLKAQRDMLKLLGEDGEAAEADGATDEAALRPGGDPAKVREILKQAGKPLHVMELLSRLGKAQTSENRATLTGTLGNYVRKGRVFAKTAPNTFGLIAGASDTGDEEDNVPEGFGSPNADKPAPAPVNKITTIDPNPDEDVPF